MAEFSGVLLWLCFRRDQTNNERYSLLSARWPFHTVAMGRFEKKHVSCRTDLCIRSFSVDALQQLIQIIGDQGQSDLLHLSVCVMIGFPFSASGRKERLVMISLYCIVRCGDQHLGILQNDVFGHEGNPLGEMRYRLGRRMHGVRLSLKAILFRSPSPP